MLTLNDEHTRQCLAIKVSRSLKSEDLVQVLDEAIEGYGRPQCILSDNGSQFVAQKSEKHSSSARSTLSPSTLAILYYRAKRHLNERKRE